MCAHTTYTTHLYLMQHTYTCISTPEVYMEPMHTHLNISHVYTISTCMYLLRTIPTCSNAIHMHLTFYMHHTY